MEETDFWPYKWRKMAIKELQEWIKAEKKFEVSRDDRFMKFLSKGFSSGARISRGYR